MATLNDKEKRDFVSQMVTIVEKDSTTFTDAGFDPATRIEQLKTEMATAEDAEAAQQKAQAAAIESTKVAQQTLKVAYDDASALVDLAEGLLGKDNSLVHKLRQLRK